MIIVLVGIIVRSISGLITHVGVTWDITKDDKIHKNLGLPRRSPIFKDGRFVFIPIVDDYMFKAIYCECFCEKLNLKLINKDELEIGVENNEYKECVEEKIKQIREVESRLGIKILRTYRDVPIRVPGYKIEDFAQEPSYLDIPVHDDPEFTTFTYGPTGSNFQYKRFCRLRKGDKLFFITTLNLYDNKEFIGRHRWWYVIGYFDVEEVIVIGTDKDCSYDDSGWASKCPRNICVEPSYEVINKYLNNVHIRREILQSIVRGDWDYIYNSKRFDILFNCIQVMIVKGSSESKLLEYAVPLTPGVLNYANIFEEDGRKGSSISPSTNIEDLFKLTGKFKAEFEEVRRRLREKIKVRGKDIRGNVKLLYRDDRGVDSAKLLLEVIDYVQRNPGIVEEFIKILRGT